MKSDDLENELRNLKFTHLTESELAAYCDQALDLTRRARAEAHLKQCFICERQVALLREESAALDNHKAMAEDVAFVERLMEQRDPFNDRAKETAPAVPLQERLAEYLRQMVASWQLFFKPVRRTAVRGKEVWRWQSEDGKLQARATMEQNADLIIYFSSNEIEMEGARLSVRLGLLSQEITLQRVSESEVAAKIAVPWQQRRGNMADISIKNV